MAGFMLKECAQQMSISYSTVRKYASDNAFMTMLREHSQQVYEQVDAELKASKESIVQRMEEASDKALDTLKELMDCEQSIVRLKAADSILDRNPQVSRTKRIEANQMHHFVDPLMLVHSAKTALEVDEYERKKLPGETTQ